MSPSESEKAIIPQITIEPSQLKRTTCDVCRERKVKCDRTKPECLRCKRSGHTCIYPSVDGEATKLNSALQTLHARLVQAELKLQQRDLVPPGDNLESSPSVGQLDVTNPHGSIDIEDNALNNLACMDNSMYFDRRDPIPINHQVGAAESRHVKLSQFEPLQTNIYSLSDNLLPELWPSDPRMDPAGIPHVWDIIPNEAHHDTQTGDSKLSCRPKEAPQDAPEAFFEVYFEIVQGHLPLVNRHRFLSNTTEQAGHQSQALRAAIAMSGAASMDDNEAASHWYTRARAHVEKAEMELDNSSFQTLDTAQALLLIARFEFSHATATTRRALLTMARLSQLLLLLGYDRLDGASMTVHGKPQEYEADIDLSGDTDLMHEKRCTFWIAFSMHCTCSMNLSHALLNNPSEICTKLPMTTSAGSGRTLIPFPHHGDIAHTIVDTLDVFPLFILSVHHLLQTDHHEKMTTANVTGTGAPDYNFCLMHEKMDNSANAILASLMSSSITSKVHGTELRTLVLLITLSARIKLYKAAIINVQKAEFLAPVVSECQRMGVMTANAMSDILLEAEALSESRITIYKAMSLFIMPPLVAAAEIQLCVLKNGMKEIGQNVFYTNRETRQSLETMCAAMLSLRGTSDKYNSVIEEAQTFLNSAQVRKRPNPDMSGKPSPQRQRTHVHTSSESA
ncbi:hypothetical protein BGZ63DRAFT_248801 [Mariannaea sp. PMI_226]|nr:hypothetical protein BGZ63DRAFT_248801 [Mariannaea sp. PMI_226]